MNIKEKIKKRLEQEEEAWKYQHIKEFLEWLDTMWMTIVSKDDLDINKTDEEIH